MTIITAIQKYPNLQVICLHRQHLHELATLDSNNNEPNKVSANNSKEQKVACTYKCKYKTFHMKQL